MNPVQGTGGRQPLTRLIAFIDGGYLRKQIGRRFDSELIDFKILKHQLTQNFEASCNGLFRGDLLRIYYYDGRVEQNDPKFTSQEKYFSKIRDIDGYEVRFGRLKQTGENQSGPLKQKGVDVRLAVDMITKAYLNHYDFAIMIAGDDDFLDVVNAVKDTGKRVYGFYFPEHVSKDLMESWDASINIENFLNLIIKN